MVACFVGDDLKDMHALTGLGIFNSRSPVALTYEQFVQALEQRDHPLHKEVKKMRALGKQCNFTTEFGAQAAKLSTTMFVPEAEAQTYIEAKEAAFPVVVVWKEGVIQEAKQCGYVRTKLGAKRHLRDLFKSRDRSVASKADRQAVNFKVQSSSAEMTKLAEGRMWNARLEQRFDCEVIGPIHDEVIVSVVLEDLHEFIPVMHSCMAQPYADMTIPVMSSISFGWNFGPAYQIEIGDSPTREAIDRGIAQLQKQTA
jgi:DNA polymerase-1